MTTVTQDIDHVVRSRARRESTIDASGSRHIGGAAGCGGFAGGRATTAGEGLLRPR
jgi:hypothetical protein